MEDLRELFHVLAGKTRLAREQAQRPELVPSRHAGDIRVRKAECNDVVHHAFMKGSAFRHALSTTFFEARTQVGFTE